MADWPNDDPSAMNAYYGSPDQDHNLEADPDWEIKNLIALPVPCPLFYPMEETVSGKKIIVKRKHLLKTLRVHWRCAKSLENILKQIPQRFSAADIERYELDICGGVYNFRPMRSGASLSIHSWGAAIDLSHLINYWKRKYDPAAGMMPQGVVDLFQSEGWQWGGLWKNGDAMHFQATAP